MKKNVLYIFCILLAFSCKPKKPKWESGYLVPLLSTSLSINELVNDTVLRVEDDESITLIYQQNLSTIDLDNLVAIPNSGFERNYKLSSIVLNDQQFNQQITLWQLCQNWPVWGTIILASNGNNLTLPDVPNVTGGPFPVSIQSVFQTATLNAGLLDISVTNGFPVDLENVQFEISNASSGVVVVTHSFPSIPSGNTVTTTLNMAGKTIDGNMNVRLLNMDVMGGGQSYLINTNDALDVDLTFRNLQIQSATAIFPAQNIINEDINAYLDMGEAKIREAIINSGRVELEVISTVKDNINFNYKFPDATKNGVAFEINEIIPPATSSSNSVNSFTYDFSGYDLDLTGQFGVKHNILRGQLIGKIDSTGNMATLGLDDSIYINLKIKSLKPSYVKGFLGTYSETAGPIQEEFVLFNNLVDGELLLEKVETIFTIENSVGIKGDLKINQLTGSNSNTQKIVNLQSSLIASPITIDKPTDHPLVPTFKTIILDETNSNIVDLINIAPNSLTYAFELNLNKGIDSTTSDFQDFAYSSSYVKSNLGIEIPLSMIANDLTLQDTVLFDANDISEIEGARSGTLNLLVDNGFPISTDIKMSLINESGDIIKELSSASIIESAPVTSGRVTEKIRSVVSYELAEEDILKLLNSYGLIITARFNTQDKTTYQKIYDDYELIIKLTGEFNYQN